MQVSNHNLDRVIKPIVSYSLPACQTAHPTHHKWQTPQQKRRYSNCLKPTEMGKNKSSDRIWSSWSTWLLAGCAAAEPSSSHSAVADGQDTPFLFAPRTAHAARSAPGCTLISSYCAPKMNVPSQPVWESGPRCLGKSCQACTSLFIYTN